jgi:hypothetical protein
MDHTLIEEQQIAERYVTGKLPPDEAERFEEHFLSCQECLDRLDLAESMDRGFKRAASQDAAQLATQIAATRQLAVIAWLSRLGRSRQMAFLAMAVFVVAVLPGLFALRQVREGQQEREWTAAGSRTAAAEAARLRTDLEASRRDLAREQAARTKMDEELAAARRPQVNIPVLYLDAERGSGESSHRLRLPRAPGGIVFGLTIEPPYQPSYHAVLRDAGGREIWSGEGLQPNELDSLSLSLPSTLLTPGDYTFTVEGLAPGRRPVAAGRFAFHVNPAS